MTDKMQGVRYASTRLNNHKLQRVGYDELDVVNEDKYLTTRELAKRWRYSVGTLANQRSKGIGCPYVKIGGTILYPASKVYEWENLGYVIAEEAKGVPAQMRSKPVKGVTVLLRETGVLPRRSSPKRRLGRRVR
jgi:hypothetical protein